MAMSRKVQLILNGKAAGNDALKTAVARERAIGHTIVLMIFDILGRSVPHGDE